ncbi:asparaginase [Advenella mimigardefordensis]|uniref:L-asparaginase n=1 Tax=Advenella mimigardefordensis (strain DSM 17166 / LMG 22922 / DPN7) TaxID=1247726 RepID=W0PDW0_ADVMD|nr:asparaginase [Advenella mimigardefordensis]AHG64956.1 L-asparaginase [Advenella mimigardefordensis DPN7]
MHTHSLNLRALNCASGNAILATAAIVLSTLLAPLPATAAEPAATTSAASSESTSAKPRIIILATGGTISGAADARSAIGYNSGEVSGQQLVQGVPGIEKLATVKSEQISNIGSQDMNDKVWFALAKRIRQIFDGNEADGVVITHGTDTMEETAFFLNNVLDSAKPVVLVGSMRPGSALSADGPLNLYEAVEVAASAQARGRGVMVVMNETIHAPRWVTKTNVTSVQSFQSLNAGPLGYVDPASVRFLAPVGQAAAARYTLPKDDQLPRVDIVYAHSNMDATQIDHAIQDNARGIVIAGVGDGNVSKPAMEAMLRAVQKGLVVVRATRVPSGFVNRNVEVDDDKSGFVVAYDLNPQKARVLTQLLIANGVTAADKVQQAFAATY